MTTVMYQAIILLLPAVALSSLQPEPDTTNAAEPIAPNVKIKTPSPTLLDAQDLLMSGSYEEAVSAFTSLATQKDRRIPARLGLARCRLAIGEYDKAIAELIELDAEGDADWHYLLARLYRTTGDYPQTVTHAQAAIKQNKAHAGARLLLGQMFEMLGRRDDAIETYRWFDRQLLAQNELLRDAAWVTNTAVGFLRFSVMTRTNVSRRLKHVLQEMLQMAYGRLDRTYWPAHIAAGDILRERYNNSAEDGSVSDYRAALRINGNLAEAHVGLGEVALERWGFEEVERHAKNALGINPNLPAALHLLARKSIIERRYEDAIETCQKALLINPNDPVAISVAAAASACRFDDATVAQWEARLKSITPSFARFHRTLGVALSGIRQYAESERAFEKAIELDGTDANARTELGMMYMQWGREKKARAALEGAWTLDPFNERTDNTLELLEILEHFAKVETENFTVKYDPKRDPGIGQLVANYMEEIHEEVTSDYETTLTEKTIIEFFPTHREFGVRITGRPWIYTIGASTGRVIALASPRDAAQTFPLYNLARVLKHEYAHTVTLAATRNRIPHWFTEGLAVFQESGERPFAWRELLAHATRRGELFNLGSIDWAFIRPKKTNDRQMAYAQSEWMVQYIIERFGFDVINTMLNLYRSGKTQPEVFAELFELPLDRFFDDFTTWAKAQVAEWGYDLTPPESILALRILATDRPDDAAVQGRLARGELDEEEYERAFEATQKALAVDEREPDGLEVFAELLYRSSKESQFEQDKYDQQAQPILKRLCEVKPDSRIAWKYLAEIAMRNDDYDAALEPLKTLQRICEADPTSWSGLAGIYLQREDYERALPQLLQLSRLDESDPKVPTGIASIYKRRGQLREAQYWYRTALFIDPFSLTILEALGDTAMRLSDTRAALDAYERLTKLEPQNAKRFEDAAFAAHKLGDTNKSQIFARRAVELNPSSSARSLLP